MLVGIQAELQHRLSTVDEVVFALLFGSRTKRTSRADSDWDVAVYLADHLTSKQQFHIRLTLLAELEDLGSIDLVVLNDAPPLLAQRALQGERLLIKEPSIFVRFFVRTAATAGDEGFWHGLHAAARARRLEEGQFGRP